MRQPLTTTTPQANTNTSSTIANGCCIAITDNTTGTEQQQQCRLSFTYQSGQIPYRILEEDILEAHVLDDNDTQQVLPIQMCTNEDASLLRRSTIIVQDSDNDNTDEQLLVKNEHQNSENDELKNDNDYYSISGIDSNTDDDELVTVHIAQPTFGTVDKLKLGCSCHFVEGDWNRVTRHFRSTALPQQQSEETQFQLIDFTRLQQQRRYSSSSNMSFQMDTLGQVFHILRSVLRCDHDASPWNDSYSQNKHEQPIYNTDQVIGILLLQHPNDITPDTDDNDYDELEQNELNAFRNFRTSDASPSYFLYSVSALTTSNDDNSHVTQKLLQSIHASATNTTTTATHMDRMTLLMYKKLPPRNCLSSLLPSRAKSSHKLPKGCLWEEYQTISDKNKNPTAAYRIVAPPYQLVNDLYPSVLDSFAQPDNLKRLIQEAVSIPQWTAWPETNHYSSTSEGGASWSVFPLCHTFPATNVANKRWISKTCQYVPFTHRLLQQIGSPLRTALFSRLEPNTILGAHRGWADLANHVLRIHIPLVCPKMCGMWVDGCVEYHKVGQILAFDDSKVHRAFNYSCEERLVLILDLVRPPHYPQGTSTGSHTDELDEFIQQFV